LPENDFPLDVQFYTGTSKNELKRAKPSKIGNLKGYELNTGDFMRLTLMNSSTETWHVYMIDIDQDGRINPIPLWDSDTQFDGLASGGLEDSYVFKHDGDAPGMSEFRLFASPRRIKRLISPPSTAARGVIIELDEAVAMGVKSKSIIYRAVPKELMPKQ
jgi:hypothetical protein